MIFSKDLRFLSICVFGLLVLSSIGSHPIAQVSESSITSTPTQSTYEGVKPSDFSIPKLDSLFEYQLDVVFLGFNESRIDQTLLEENIPEWYAPIDRINPTDSLAFDVNYTLSYNFEYVDDTSVEQFRDFMFTSANLADEPFFSLLNNDTYYIPSIPVENYLYENFMNSDRPTLFVVDIYTRDPDNHREHLYNVSSTDLDGFSDPRLYGSQYQIAGGGKDHRLLWVDLSVGGSDYRDSPIYGPAGINDTLIPPVWDTRYDGNTENLTIDISKYISTAIELRYLPSYLYTPGYAFEEVRFEMKMVNIDSSGFDFYSEIDGDYITDQYSRLNPNLDWTYTLSDWDWESDSDFVTYLEASRNDTTRSYSGGLILSYLDSMYQSLFNQSTSDTLVIPVFLFAFPSDYMFSSFLGYAKGIDGDFAYVVSANNVYYATDGYKLQYNDIYKSTGIIIPASSTGPAAIALSLTLGNYNTLLETNVTVNSGQMDIFLMDENNYVNYTNGDTYDFIADYTGITSVLEENQSLGIYDQYKLVFQNPYGVDAAFDLEIDSFIDRTFGLTFVSMHEAGHAVGLAHPHDGYTWEGNNVYQAGVDYLYWLWDHSYSQMTYASHIPTISIMDVDTSMRGSLPKLYRDTQDYTNGFLDDIAVAHTYIPENLYPMINSSSQDLSDAESRFDDYERIDNLNHSMNSVFTAYDQLVQTEQQLPDSWYNLDIDVSSSDPSVEVTDLSYELKIPAFNLSYSGNVGSQENITISHLPYADYSLKILLDGEVIHSEEGKIWQHSSSLTYEKPDEPLQPPRDTITAIDTGRSSFLPGFGLMVAIPVIMVSSRIITRARKD